MSDDIVAQLREEADFWCHDSAVRIFLEAADEIERLREQIKALVHEWELSERGVHNEHKAVRGE